MIPFEDAYQIVRSSIKKISQTTIPLDDVLGYVLAENVYSDMNMPPFRKSAMDGYACRTADIYGELEVIEVIAAGEQPTQLINKGQCAKIMTGAMLPEGADCVLIVEDMKVLANKKVRYTKVEIESCQLESSTSMNLNICELGEDVQKGQLVLEKNTFLKAQHLAVLASVGCVNPTVYRKPKVGIIPTGDELVEPHQKPSVSQIRNSNGVQTVAQLRAMGIDANYYGIARDNKQATKDLIHTASIENDLVILTGGVSMGDFDFVPKVLMDAGFDLLFQSVAVQPGKPTTFGVNKNKYCFGLPGNPVSSFTQFELLVKPLLLGMMGHEHKPLNIRLPLAADYLRRKASRMSWVPVKINETGEVEMVEYHGSAHIFGLTIADGFVSYPIGVKELKKGDWINVRSI